MTLYLATILSVGRRDSSLAYPGAGYQVHAAGTVGGTFGFRLHLIASFKREKRNPGNPVHRFVIKARRRGQRQREVFRWPQRASRRRWWACRNGTRQRGTMQSTPVGTFLLQEVPHPPITRDENRKASLVGFLDMRTALN